jgi:hypothetical protein
LEKVVLVLGLGVALGTVELPDGVIAPDPLSKLETAVFHDVEKFDCPGVLSCEMVVVSDALVLGLGVALGARVEELLDGVIAPDAPVSGLIAVPLENVIFAAPDVGETLITVLSETLRLGIGVPLIVIGVEVLPEGTKMPLAPDVEATSVAQVTVKFPAPDVGAELIVPIELTGTFTFSGTVLEVLAEGTKIPLAPDVEATSVAQVTVKFPAPDVGTELIVPIEVKGTFTFSGIVLEVLAEGTTMPLALDVEATSVAQDVVKFPAPDVGTELIVPIKLKGTFTFSGTVLDVLAEGVMAPEAPEEVSNAVAEDMVRFCPPRVSEPVGNAELSTPLPEPPVTLEVMVLEKEPMRFPPVPLRVETSVVVISIVDGIVMTTVVVSSDPVPMTEELPAPDGRTVSFEGTGVDAPLSNVKFEVAVADEMVNAPVPAVLGVVSFEAAGVDAPLSNVKFDVAVSHETVKAPVPAVLGITVSLEGAGVEAPLSNVKFEVAVADEIVNAPVPAVLGVVSLEGAGVDAPLSNVKFDVAVADEIVKAPVPTVLGVVSLEGAGVDAPLSNVKFEVAVADEMVSAPVPAVLGVVSLEGAGVDAPLSNVKFEVAVSHETVKAPVPSVLTTVCMSVLTTVEFALDSGTPVLAPDPEGVAAPSPPVELAVKVSLDTVNSAIPVVSNLSNPPVVLTGTLLSGVEIAG